MNTSTEDDIKTSIEKNTEMSTETPGGGNLDGSVEDNTEISMEDKNDVMTSMEDDKGKSSESMMADSIENSKTTELAIKNEVISEDKTEEVIPSGNKSVDTVEPSTGISSVSEDSLGGFEDSVITSEMIMEEEKIRKQLNKEENALKKKMALVEKEKTFQRLLNLLSRSQLYAKYLQDKMKEQKELSAIQGKKAKSEKENIKQSSVRTTRVSELNSSNTKQEVITKKRGRPKSIKDSTPNSKRKKLEDIELNNSQKSLEEAKEAEVKTSLNTAAELRIDRGFSDQISPRQPELLVGGVMREYQLEGFEWLKVLYENGINGILADEMGLGKTIQCIALVAHLMNKSMTGPYLIVAPLSTLPNWLAEFKRFTPQIPVILYHGDKNTRDDLRLKISKENWGKGMLPIKPVVLTSYDIAIKDATSLRHRVWRYLIVDEGHRLKNFNSRLFIELKRFTAGNRLLLTGTPLQNNLSELWSLLNFLLPEIFDNLSVFESWFDVQSMSSGETDEAIIAQEQEKHIISTLHQILNPFLLRRTKADVELNLPPKKELMVYAPLTPTQELFYKAVLDKSIGRLLQERSGIQEETSTILPRRRASTKVTDYSLFFKKFTDEELEEMDKNQRELELVKTSTKTVQRKSIGTCEIKLNTRNMLMPLRKICNHPYLLEYPLDPETGNYKIDEELVKNCGKLQILDCMLPALKSRGHKVLLFSQMTSLLNIVEDYCNFRKFTYVRLDGSNALDERQDLITTFNQKPSVFLFLLSTRAGGLGINLTAADTVIIYDSDWNPQCDLQAQDRCHRFGQTKPVVIYRLVTANTVDEKIVTRAAAKRRLEKMIMKKGRFSKSLSDSNGSHSNGFSEAELKELLNSKDHTAVVHTDSAQVLSLEQLDMLLDRRDLLRADGDQTPVVLQEQEGVFKLLDSDNLNSELNVIN